jgi:ribosomal protein L12E/L44/L45/RPP1/RPP2
MLCGIITSVSGDFFVDKDKAGNSINAVKDECADIIEEELMAFLEHFGFDPTLKTGEEARTVRRVISKFFEKHQGIKIIGSETSAVEEVVRRIIERVRIVNTKTSLTGKTTQAAGAGAATGGGGGGAAAAAGGGEGKEEDQQADEKEDEKEEEMEDKDEEVWKEVEEVEAAVSA